ncbi:MAG TPA: hypothetical protein VLA96_11095 [Terriglobales bacterium]|nr:hypothetical protein [Terriglobales bacterium]
MKLLIDNTDYTCALAADGAPRVLRRLNQPSRFECALLLTPAAPVIPAANARVVLEREDGAKLFTGYLDAIPEHEYLGWGERGPEYRLHITATSDELLLDRKALPERPPFVARPAGEILRATAASLLPGAFDVSGVTDLGVIPSYEADFQRPWSEHAAALALLARAAYRAHDGSLVFQPVGSASHTLEEESPTFTPEGLKLAAPQRFVNDATIISRAEPRLHVRDYFVGDGLTLQFDLSRTPFAQRTRVLLDEEFAGDELDPLRWTQADPAAALSSSGGQLAVAGGTATDGETRVEAVERLELGGGLLLQHGEFSFTAASDAVLGGLYAGAVNVAGCFAGFRVTPSGDQSAIQALIDGSATGSAVTTVAGHRYGMTTRLYAIENFRASQTFHSSAHPAGSGRGGGALPSGARLVLELHDIDPANPGSQGAAATVLYDAVVSDVPALVTYALLNVTTAHCSTPFARIARISGVEVRSQAPSQSYRTRLVGALADGGECQVFQTPELQFFSQYPPVAGEQIVVRYRSQARSLARVIDPASIATLAAGADDGVRSAVRYLAAPAARTSAECETAALALLDDSTQQAWAGEYRAWSDALPGGPATDVWPGDAFAVDIPSRGAEFTALVREVELLCADLRGDGSRYRIAFANDAAQPPGFAFDPARLDEPLEDVATVTTAGTLFAPDLSAAEITGATSTTVDIDCGLTPPAGWGVEVRRSDRDWGEENDRDLVGRFTTRTFTVPRLTRVVDFFLRQHDDSSPRKYSRNATLLHLDWPYS